MKPKKKVKSKNKQNSKTFLPFLMWCSVVLLFFSTLFRVAWPYTSSQICQFSSSLHYATLRSFLDILRFFDNWFANSPQSSSGSISSFIPGTCRPGAARGLQRLRMINVSTHSSRKVNESQSLDCTNRSRRVVHDTLHNVLIGNDFVDTRLSTLLCILYISSFYSSL